VISGRRRERIRDHILQGLIFRSCVAGALISLFCLLNASRKRISFEETAGKIYEPSSNATWPPHVARPTHKIESQYTDLARAVQDSVK
jgi:hypothetical protein